MVSVCFGKICGIYEKKVLVIYDIADDKRRRKMAKLLEGYGVRVQESAFEIKIRVQQYNRMLNEIVSKVHNDDNIRIYPLNEEHILLGGKNVPTVSIADIWIV